MYKMAEEEGKSSIVLQAGRRAIWRIHFLFRKWHHFFCKLVEEDGWKEAEPGKKAREKRNISTLGTKTLCKKGGFLFKN